MKSLFISLTTEKIRALNKELGDLRVKLGEKRLDFDLEARNIVPKDFYYGNGYSRDMPTLCKMAGIGRV